MEIPGLPNITGNLEQKNIINYAKVDQATDTRAPGPNELKWIALGQAHHRV